MPDRMMVWRDQDETPHVWMESCVSSGCVEVTPARPAWQPGQDYIIVRHASSVRGPFVLGLRRWTWPDAGRRVEVLRRQFPRFSYGVRSVNDPGWQNCMTPDQRRVLLQEAPYVNQSCPERCGTAHQVNQWSPLQCPATGNHWTLCDECGWIQNTRRTYPINIGDDHYCNPTEHGFYECSRCESYVPEDEDCSYCEDEDRYEEDEDEYVPDRSEAITCATCNTPRVHMDEWTERFVCDCEADALRARKRPVRMLVPVAA